MNRIKGFSQYFGAPNDAEVSKLGLYERLIANVIKGMRFLFARIISGDSTSHRP